VCHHLSNVLYFVYVKKTARAAAEDPAICQQFLTDSLERFGH